MKLAIVILVVVVLLVLWLAGTYNGLVKKKNAVEEAFSTMDDQRAFYERITKNISDPALKC